MSLSARRTGVGVALLTALTIFSAGPAAAEPTPPATGYACLDDETGYEVSGVCQLTVLRADTVCIGDLPYLDYALESEGTPPDTTATLVWGEESGTHYVMADLPLSGTVLWPGAVKGPNGEAADWPGWNLVDGKWVEGDEWNWVRPRVPLTFHVNPSATITAHYPEAAPCADPPVDEVLAEGDETQVLAEGDETQVLATTGSDAQPLLLAAGGLMLVGGLALGAHASLRRRRTGI